MGTSRIGGVGSVTTLGILTTIMIVLYLITVTVVAVWWTKEERKFANKTVARIERQLEICKKEQ